MRRSGRRIGRSCVGGLPRGTDRFHDDRRYFRELGRHGAAVLSCGNAPYYDHPVINAGVVLQGELTVVAENGLSKTFSAGSGIVELVNTFHYGENRGTVPVDLAMFYAGGADLPLSVKR